MKAFWEAVEAQLAARSSDELRAILRAMALVTPQSEREQFLAQLGSAAPVPDPPNAQEDLLKDIEDCADELEAKMQGADEWGAMMGAAIMTMKTI